MQNRTEGTTRRQFVLGGAGAAALIAGMGFNRLASAQEGDALVTQLVRFKLKPEKEQEALEALKWLADQVKANEPDVLAYVPHRSQKNTEEIVFFEVYKNQEALSAHGQTQHMAEMRPKFGTLFNPPFDIERLDRVGGYVR